MPRAAQGSGTFVGTVAALRRYPVKSLCGEDLPAAEVGAHGVAGDRTQAVIDRRTGKVGSAKDPPAVAGAAHHVGDRVPR